MNRRTFMGAIAAVAAALGLKSDEKYGYIHIDDALHRGLSASTVLLNGVDVSRQCYACDDRAGMVWLFKRNKDGQKYFDQTTGAVAKEVRRGRVQFIPRRHL